MYTPETIPTRTVTFALFLEGGFSERLPVIVAKDRQPVQGVPCPMKESIYQYINRTTLKLHC